MYNYNNIIVSLLNCCSGVDSADLRFEMVYILPILFPNSVVIIYNTWLGRPVNMQTDKRRYKNHYEGKIYSLW